MTQQSFSALTSAEVNRSVQGRTLVWPIGATEQHGPHLPLSVDSDLAEAFAGEIAAGLGGFTLPVHQIAARSLPQSGGGLSFPGTLYVGGDTLIRYIREVLESLVTLPFECLIIVNGHFENEPFLFEALDQVRGRGLLDGREVYAFSWWSLVQQSWITSEVPGFPGWHAEHAGLTETSLMLHLRPDLVTTERPDHDNPPRNGVYLHPIDVEQATNKGILSSTSGSSAELGEKLFRHVIDEALAMIRQGEGLLLARSRRDRRGRTSPKSHGEGLDQAAPPAAALKGRGA
ncbi:creatininase family protein [Streptomyces sp. NPDC056682]|uniref:creatininase family protein n=1 Tax=Streptomyces sp. NPDC056682 TaxID=3345909 RepID=UPI0036A555E6